MKVLSMYIKLNRKQILMVMVNVDGQTINKKWTDETLHAHVTYAKAGATRIR